MDKLERQLGLLAALLHTAHPLRASEIHQRVDGYPEDVVAFRRAFERDKDDLRRLGVPLEISRTEAREGTIDGYRVNKSEYYLHDLGLEPDEVVALSVALRLIRLEGGAAHDALWKLGGDAISDDDRPPQLAAIAMGPSVTQLHEAITSNATVHFEYRGQKRSVEPWRLAFRRGQWYLHAWDVDREDSRMFRLDRVEGAIRVGEPDTAQQARLAPTDERQPWQFGSDAESEYLARVAIDRSHAAWARHHLGEESVVADHADGSIEIELAVTNVSAFRSLVLSMFDAAVVLSPIELRNDVVAWLEAQQS